MERTGLIRVDRVRHEPPDTKFPPLIMDMEECMAIRKTPAAQTEPRGAAKRAGADVPQLFRLNVEVGNLEEAADFYATLLGVVGRK